jgi:hypothetical protein
MRKVTTYTPGPWVAKVEINHETASDHFAIEAPEHDGPCPCGGKHPKGKLIAWLSGGGRVWHDTVAPDARLIAAAPDLLEALKALVIDANRLCDRNLGGTYEEDCRRTLVAARAALSKAVPATSVDPAQGGE